MDYALNLILSLEDNATGGLSSAADALGGLCSVAEQAAGTLGRMSDMASLQLLGKTATEVGNSFIGMGKSIIGTVGGAIDSVRSVGAEVTNATRALGQLYAGADATDAERWAAGTEKVGEAMEYAAHSIFNFSDLLPVIQMMKANSIEAFDDITSSSGETTQTLMDYAADLAAFNPGMHNAYGKGIQAAMGAINEYVAEGNKRSLKSGASLDVTGILGEGVADTIEDRERQIADLLEKLNIAGYVQNLSGTVEQQLANMEDVWYIFLSKISDSGVYAEINTIVKKFSDAVNSIPMDELEEVAGIVGEAFTELLEPLEAAADKIVELGLAFKDLIKAHPKLAKFAITGTAIAGVVVLLGGVALKAVGTFAIMINAINTMGATMGMFSGGVLLPLIGAVGSVIAAVALLRLAWVKDFGGIASTTTRFLTSFVAAWNKSTELLHVDVGIMVDEVRRLGESGTFLDNLTIGLTKLRTIVKGVWEAFTSEDGYTISEETWQQLDQLGVLPVLNHILDLKARVEEFIKGFTDSWGVLSDTIEDFTDSLASMAKGTFIEDLIDKFDHLMQTFTKPGFEDFRDAGETFAQITQFAIPAAGAVKGVSTAFDLLSDIPGVSTLGDVLKGSVVNTLGRGADALKGALSPVGDRVTEAISTTLTPSGMTDAISGMFDAVGGSFEGFGTVLAHPIQSLQNAGNTLKGNVSGIWTGIQNTLGPAGPWLNNMGQTISGGIGKAGSVAAKGLSSLGGTISNALPDVVKQAGSAIGGVAGEIAPGISSFMGFVGEDLIGGFGKVFSGVGERIAPMVGPVFSGIGTAATTMFPVLAFGGALAAGAAFISDHSDGIKGAFNDIWNAIPEPVRDMITQALGMIQEAFWGLVDKLGIRPQVEEIITTFQSVVDYFTTNILPTVLEIGHNVMDLVGQVKDFLVNIFQGIILPVITQVVESARSIWDSWLQGLVMNLMGLVSRIMAVLTPLLPTIGSIITGIMKIVTPIVNFVGNTINSIIEVVNGIIDFLVGVFTGDIDKAFEGIKEIFSGFKDFISGIVDGITGVINGIKDAVSGVAGSIADFLGFSTPKTGPLSDYETWMPDMAQGLSTTLTASSPVIESSVNKIGTTMKDSFKRIFNEIPKIAQEGMRGVESALRSASSSIQGILDSLSSKASTWGKHFMEGMRSGIVANKGSVINAVEGVASEVEARMHFSAPDVGPLADYESWMPDFMEGLALGIRNNRDLVIGQLKILGLLMSKEIGSWDSSLDIPVSGTAALEASLKSVIPDFTSLDDTDKTIIVDPYMGGAFSQFTTSGTPTPPSFADDPLWVPMDTYTGSYLNPYSDYYDGFDGYDEYDEFYDYDGDDYEEYYDEDNSSYTIESGAISIQVANASSDEAERLAELIMQKIESKRKVNDIMHYRY